MAEADKDEQDLVLLCRIGGYMQAEMIQQVLEGEGIASFADGENFSVLYGGAVSDIRLLVRRCDWWKAVDALRDISEQTGQKIDITYARTGEPKCPRCAYVLYYARDSRCPECGRPFLLEEISLEKAEVVDGVVHPR